MVISIREVNQAAEIAVGEKVPTMCPKLVQLKFPGELKWFEWATIQNETHLCGVWFGEDVYW